MKTARPQWGRRAIAIPLALVGLGLLIGFLRGGRDDDAATPVRLAWFFSAPVDGTDAETVARTSADIVLTGRNDLEFRDELRDSGYEGAVLQYVDLPYARGPESPLDDSFSAWDNQVAWHPGDFATLIHPNERWFLHGPNGDRCREQIDSSGIKYVMNPASPGWRSFFLKRVRWAMANWGYDGVFLDNLWRAPLAKLTRVCRGMPRELASDAEWRQASVELILAVKRLGVPVWANTDGPSVYGRDLDGWMFEAFAGSWEGTYQSEADTADLLSVADRHAREGKGVILVAQGGRGDVHRVRYSMAAYLLVAGPRVSFRYSNSDGLAYENFWRYPEYEVSLGLPAGPRRLVSGSLWRRDFARGHVEVDLAARVSKIVVTDG